GVVGNGILLMKFLSRRLACFGCLVVGFCFGDDRMPAPLPWDVCYWMEGKGEGCSASNPPALFKKFLQRSDMDVKWEEFGKLGGHRLRHLSMRRSDRHVRVCCCTGSTTPVAYPGNGLSITYRQ